MNPSEQLTEAYPVRYKIVKLATGNYRPSRRLESKLASIQKKSNTALKPKKEHATTEIITPSENGDYAQITQNEYEPSLPY